ncbi:uncharacterized protein [Lolium perenne]|uniref:uncharacterized protein n=1 Tax=Lolium perenne TaxID=4522 RepID=UPI0021F67287|nr:uncharacterized protein LOC127348018 [Lolium perenne]
MGSWFSSPAPTFCTAAAGHDVLRELWNRQAAISIPGKFDAIVICDLANWALEHYNSNHPGAPEFHCHGYLTPELDLKAACVGFRKDLWYHLNFLARRTSDGHAVETRRFFAEMRFEPSSDRLIVETCIILEEPCSNFSTSCAFCPDEYKILHPSEFECGKEGHEKEFFRHRCGMDGRTKVFFSENEMLHTPFMLGAAVPRYRL